MRKKISALMIVLVLVFGFAFLAPSATEEVDALPANATFITYYSDATYQVEVGYRYISCVNGGSSSGGQVTEFRIVETWPC